MQQRYPTQRPPPLRTKSGRPAAPRLAGRALPPHGPARSTKVSEKLVLLPETAETEDELEEKADYAEDNDLSPVRDDEEELRRTGARRGKSYAERLPKSRRADKLARVTAYCTAKSYKLKATAAFLRDHHGAQTKLYDDCLYAVFQLPLLPGTDGYRVRSSPMLKNTLSSANREAEMERLETRDYDEHVFEDRERFDVPVDGADSPYAGANGGNVHQPVPAVHHDSEQSHRSSSPPPRMPADALTVAELYIFAYGVAVFWNFSAHQEKDVLADLTFYGRNPAVPSTSLLSPKRLGSLPSPITSQVPPTPPTPLVVAPQSEDDFETEEFHFEYAPSAPRPRVFNDMITLRSGDHMVKLAIAHAIAQSTKLSTFEQQAAARMAQAADLPRRLALTGALGLSRGAVLRLLGAMYMSRVDVNLASQVLDTPGFFWDAEPTLHPLYAAVREYLELGPRVKSLNERCRVFLDLAEILSDGVADSKSSYLTWIVIVLIAVSIVVTISEVFLRFGMLSTRGGAPAARTAAGRLLGRGRGGPVRVGPGAAITDEGMCVCLAPAAAAKPRRNLTLDAAQQVWDEAGKPAEL